MLGAGMLPSAAIGSQRIMVTAVVPGCGIFGVLLWLFKQRDTHARGKAEDMTYAQLVVIGTLCQARTLVYCSMPGFAHGHFA